MEYHKEYMASFFIAEPQAPVCVVTVLKPGQSGFDCAAYRGVVPAAAMDEDSSAETCMTIARHGNKISEAEARELFDLGELVYRK